MSKFICLCYFSFFIFEMGIIPRCLIGRNAEDTHVRCFITASDTCYSTIRCSMPWFSSLFPPPSSLSCLGGCRRNTGGRPLAWRKASLIPGAWVRNHHSLILFSNFLFMWPFSHKTFAFMWAGALPTYVCCHSISHSAMCEQVPAIFVEQKKRRMTSLRGGSVN